MKVYGVGRLTRDIDVIYSAGGVCVAKFGLAENIYNGKTQKSTAQFYNIVVFNKLSERIGNLNLGKGDKIQIEGYLQIQDYVNKKGDKGKYTQIVLSGFELCTTKKQDTENK